MRNLALCGAVLLALAPAAVGAQQNLYRFELTPTVSYNFGGTLDSSNNDLFNADLEMKDSEAFGLTFDIPLSSHMQLELLASRQSSELRFDDGLFLGSTGVADMDVSYYHVGMLWQWGDRRVSPFFVTSIGVANLSPDLPGASDENRFSLSIGGGVKVFLSENIGLRFEGRGFVSDLGGDNNDHHHDCGYYNDSCYGNEFSQGQASAGLIIAW